MKSVKIQIKNRFTGSLIFEYEKDDNTIKDTLLEAINRGADLSGAYLSGADLSGADLSDADLRGADLSGADLSGADLRGAYLSGADLSDADLRGADLSDADLRGAYLRDAYLSDAYLSGADLSGADLSDADLRGADLSGADLRDAYLSDADLSGAYLRGAYLRGAYLSGADLSGADLSGAYLSGAYLSGAKEIPYVPLACPSDGAFIGWKKVHGKLVKLEIPEDALRCSCTSRKCRCSKAKVLSITDFDGENPVEEILNDTRRTILLYKVGEMVYPDSFDDDRWKECSHGIHFFINKQDAINY